MTTQQLVSFVEIAVTQWMNHSLAHSRRKTCISTNEKIVCEAASVKQTYMAVSYCNIQRWLLKNRHLCRQRPLHMKVLWFK